MEKKWSWKEEEEVALESCSVTRHLCRALCAQILHSEHKDSARAAVASEHCLHGQPQCKGTWHLSPKVPIHRHQRLCLLLGGNKLQMNTIFHELQLCPSWLNLPPCPSALLGLPCWCPSGGVSRLQYQQLIVSLPK